MISEIIIYLLLTHFVADFTLQTNWMAINKSKRWIPLLVHVLVYSLCFLWVGPMYALVNAGLHFVTDAITSRITSRLWALNQRHWFFVVIGLDQLIHQVCLIWSYKFYGM